jgi:hypothetical protein
MTSVGLLALTALQHLTHLRIKKEAIQLSRAESKALRPDELTKSWRFQNKVRPSTEASAVAELWHYSGMPSLSSSAVTMRFHRPSPHRVHPLIIRELLQNQVSSVATVALQCC